MNPFLVSYDELEREFRGHGVQVDRPGFCDSEAFLRVEQSQCPEYLNNYAAFVARREYAPKYLEHARQTITNVANLLHAELVDHGRLGACVDISGILGRMLEQEGVWSCGIKGSLTIEFPTASKLSTKYFWSVDEGDFMAGHAWLFAPPFTVVDIAVRQQNYSARERQQLPQMVLSECTEHSKVTPKDYISPVARTAFELQGVPTSNQLNFISPHIPHIFNCFPAITEITPSGTALKYAPIAVHAPDGTFEEMSNMTFDGLSPHELYLQKVRPALTGTRND